MAVNYSAPSHGWQDTETTFPIGVIDADSNWLKIIVIYFVQSIVGFLGYCPISLESLGPQLKNFKSASAFQDLSLLLIFTFNYR